jgi:hypothetical protein
MGRSTPILLLLACVSLLTLQWAGAHAHAGVRGFDGAVHSTHDHHHDGDHDEHAGDVDVPVADYVLSIAKLAFVAFVVAIALFALFVQRYETPAWVGVISPRWRERWRPPLRGPPLPYSV